jgi:hypothetical protein
MCDCPPDPKQLYPGDPTPDLPYFDDDWCRFYGPRTGDVINEPTHFEVHELCWGQRCSFRNERCPFHPPDCRCCGDSTCQGEP